MIEKTGGSSMWIIFISMCVVLFSVQRSKEVEQMSFQDPWIEANDAALIDYVASVKQTFAPVVDDPKPVPIPSPSDKPAAKEIIIYMGLNCPPCDRWKRCEMSRFQEAGWKVAICDPSQHDYSRTPTFSITLDGKTVQKTGYISLEEVAEVVK
jgi:hypothetical protein